MCGRKEIDLPLFLSYGLVSKMQSILEGRVLNIVRRHLMLPENFFLPRKKNAENHVTWSCKPTHVIFR